MELSDHPEMIGPLLPTNMRKKNSQIGPSLPPHLINKLESSSDCSEENSDEESSDIQQQLPPHLQKKYRQHEIDTRTEKECNIGPRVPPHLEKTFVYVGRQLPLHLPKKSMSTEDKEHTSIRVQLPPQLVDKPPEGNSATYGPQLHPHLVNSRTGKECNIGPQLPPHIEKTFEHVGPQLPPHLQNKSISTEDKEHTSIEAQLPPQLVDKPQEGDSETYGPQLPPHLVNKLTENINSTQPENKAPKTIGPQLPSHLRKQLEVQAKICQGPEEGEDGNYGPMPAGSSNISAAEIALEERAIQMQIDKLTPQSKEPVREEWMTELPEARARSLGLGPRQFRKNAAPDMSDRSSWTTIAGEKPTKETKEDSLDDLRVEAEEKQLEKRDKEQALEAKKHKRKSKSLVDIHQEKLKKKDSGISSNERRPFSRDVDLQVNKFDDAQKKAIMKKAQLLDDRFSSGKSKFL